MLLLATGVYQHVGLLTRHRGATRLIKINERLGNQGGGAGLLTRGPDSGYVLI